MIDYKATLNLPQTDFPMKAGLPQREPEILQRWDGISLYQSRALAGRNSCCTMGRPMPTAAFILVMR